MKHIISAVLMVGVIAVSAVGCSEKTSATKKTSVSTPEGSTTQSTTTETKKSGAAILRRRHRSKFVSAYRILKRHPERRVASG